MPQLPPVHAATKRPSSGHAADAKGDPMELLLAIRDDPALPLQLKERLSTALGRIQDPKRQLDPLHGHRVTNKGGAQQVFEQFLGGKATLRFCFTGNSVTHSRARHFDIAASKPAGAALLTPTSTPLQRETPALQNPKSVFEELNMIAFQTLRYIEEVEEIEFDVTNVREHDGTVMQDKERLFLSICCSVFSNFSFFTSLHINAAKFFHFLGELFATYGTDNSYHNATHAADALQMMSLFFREPSVNFLFTDQEIAISFLAALCLDVAHPGSTDALLVALEHPLSSVFGGVATAAHASLLVLTSTLMRDDNFFLPHGGPSPLGQPYLLKEALYEVVLGAPACNRPALMSALRDVAVSGAVVDLDVPKLMSALLVMAHNSFAFRSQTQFCRIGSWLLTEFRREEGEAQRHGILATVPHITPSNGFATLVDYVEVVVRPVTAAVRALVPTDLRDRLDGNTDARAAAAGDRVITGLIDSSQSAWSASSVTVMEVLKKVATHADSVDRKASKCAILNASPARSSGMVRADSVSSISSASESLSATRRDEPPSASMQPSALSVSQLYSAASSPNLRPGRSEHYFSFLRLYDKCDRAGEAARSFLGQLVFLALQLDPRYIAAYARKAYGEGCSGADCAEMALLITDTEEAPSSAEVIASRVPGGSFSTRAADEIDHTDGFLLFLMEMYCSREEAQAAMEQDSADDARTQSPVSPPEAATFEAAQQFQKNSPIRMPVNTESKNFDARQRLIP